MRALLALALLLALPAPAAAADGLERGISDGVYFNSGDPAQRALGLARTKVAGARFVRIQLSWRYVTRATSTPEQARNPGWEGYRFEYVDRIVREAVAAGLEPLVVVKSAPAQHEAQPRWPFAAVGTWSPDPAAFGDFAQAVSLRYSGVFPDPQRPGRTLPSVRYWQAWNEPNLPVYLQPQWVAVNGRWLPFSPAHYRKLLNAFEAGIRVHEPDAVVLAAGTAPLGERDGLGRMPPVRFWQSFFCLGKPPGLTPSPCPDPARFDVFAHHPFSIGDPDGARRPSLDTSVADLHRLTEILRAAERTGRALGAARHPVWVTELNWDTNPPDPQGLNAVRQHRWVPRALYRLAAEGVQVVFWHFISDRSDPRHPAGLWRAGSPGKAKPALRAFRFPFVAVRGSEREVRLWGLLPQAGPRGVAIERRRSGGRWRKIGGARVSAAGVIGGTFRLRGAATLRARAGAEVSPAWRVGPG